MNAFEQIVSRVLEFRGYWVKPSFMADLTREQKALIGKPSSPRHEVDLVAYHPAANELLIVECKSYLDSRGVQIAAVDGTDETAGNRFKLFNDAVLRREVCAAIVKQLNLPSNPSVSLCLAAGRIAKDRDLQALRELFAEKKWVLITRDDLVADLKMIGRAGYEDSQISMMAKLMGDEPRRRKPRP
ncbi:MAG: hypothetical protein AB7N70_35775 [Dehalococcoidia bacterium]